MPDLIRVSLHSPGQAGAFMRELGVSGAGCRLMAGKCAVEPVLVRNVTCAEANILKQAMLSLGGDAAIHREVITGRVERSDALLLGTRRQLRKLAAGLAAQSFSLPARGRDLERLLGDPPAAFHYAGGSLALDRLRVMGVLNVTPDSFSDGGRFLDPAAALGQAGALRAAGADIIDIGGESTRPGADPVAEDEELRRVMPVLEALKDRPGCPVSIDTRRPAVARRALAAGAAIVNDIGGCGDPALVAAVAAAGAGVIIMHMQGEPRTMQAAPRYDRVVDDILAFLEERAAAAMRGGVAAAAIMVDPGIGFGKTAADNLAILRRIADLRGLGFPVLVGASRKSFIGRTLGLPAERRLPADIAVTAWCAQQGVAAVRVHDVGEAVIARDMVRAIARGMEG
ncbi:MAG: dihydropteroate synthase [Planctomycetota bacterium]